MAFVNPTAPNLADFITFCQGQGVQVIYLPADSEYYGWAFTVAVDRVLYVPPIPGIEYSLACYNLGLHWLATQASDTAGGTFFCDLRSKYNLLGFTPGVVQSASDNGTGSSLAIPDFFRTLTLEQLDFIKTPWGRAYLAYAQKAGPTVIGIS